MGVDTPNVLVAMLFLLKKKDTEILEKVQKEPQKLSDSKSKGFSENNLFSQSEPWDVIWSQVVEKCLVLMDYLIKRGKKVSQWPKAETRPIQIENKVHMFNSSGGEGWIATTKHHFGGSSTQELISFLKMYFIDLDTG